jgi:hypothetical protein
MSSLVMGTSSSRWMAWENASTWSSLTALGNVLALGDELLAVRRAAYSQHVLALDQR